MKELQTAFNEVLETYKTVWSRKSHFTRIITTLFVIAILPIFFIFLLGTLGAFGFAWVDYFYGFITASLFAYPVATSLVFLFIIVIIPALLGTIGAIGLTSKIKSIIAHKNQSIRAVYARGMKKFFPAVWLGIMSILPLVTALAALVYIEINVWFATLAILASLWLLITSFAKFLLLIDGDSAVDSLIRSVPLVLKNIYSLILRVIVSSAIILLPMSVVSALITIIHGYVIQLISGYPTLEIAYQAIEDGPFTVTEAIASTLFDIASVAFSLFVVLPIVIVYIVKIFDLCKENSAISKKSQSIVYNTTLGIYVITTVLAIAIAIKVIL